MAALKTWEAPAQEAGMGCQCHGHAVGSQTQCRRQALVLHPQRSCMGCTLELRSSAVYRQDQPVHVAALIYIGARHSSHSASAGEQLLVRAPLECEASLCRWQRSLNSEHQPWSEQAWLPVCKRRGALGEGRAAPWHRCTQIMGARPWAELQAGRQHAGCSNLQCRQGPDACRGRNCCWCC